MSELLIKPRQFFRLYPWVVQLKAYGQDYDQAEALINILYKKIFGKKGIADGLGEKLTAIKPLLDPQKKTILKTIWLRRNWLSWYRVYVPKENFADTTGIELAMANIKYLNYASCDKNTPAAEYNKHLGNVLGHVVKHKRWAWKKMAYEWCKYDTAQATATGQRIMRQLNAGKIYWLLNYFEDTNRQFIEYYQGVFESDGDSKPLYPNGEGWIALLEDIARDQVHGEFNQVSGTAVHTLFLYLKHQRIKVNEEIRKQKTA